jgi:hypothetical protein
VFNQPWALISLHHGGGRVMRWAGTQALVDGIWTGVIVQALGAALG